MTIPFLIDFTPYSLNGIACQSIDDMVSISLQQAVPISNITYNIASSDDINVPLLIKNITNNASLQINIIFDKNVFVVDSPSIPFTLNAGEVQQLSIRLNKPQLNQSVGKLSTSIKFEIKNVLNGTVVTKNTSVDTLTINSLTETVDISS